MALDYLPSPGWAVIYGETPSATRWSELGDNDDALATGAGIDDLAILTRHLAAGAATDDKWRNGITFRAYTTTNQSASGGVFTKMPLSLEEWDLGNDYDTSLYRFIVPVDGIYYMNCSVSAPNNDTRIFGSIYVNGAEKYRTTNGSYTGSANRAAGGRPMKLLAGDYVELYFWRQSAGLTDSSQDFAVMLAGFLITRI